MRPLLIVYGSETGTAQDTAETLRREAILQGLPVKLLGLDEYDFDELVDENVLVFVVATTGQGEVPPNMRNFWKKLLRKSLPNTLLENKSVAVFGLGDSSYQKYNFAGKKLYRRLIQLGTNILLPLGLGDDQHELGIDGALIPWKQTLWKQIYERNFFKDVMKDGFDPSISIPPRFVLSDTDNGSQESKSNDEYHELYVLKNERVTASDHFQDTRLIQFGIPDDVSSEFRYEPGDVLMVRPYNHPETIEIAVNAMGFTDDVLDKEFYLRANNDPFARLPPTWLIGKKTTLRICLTRLFDLQTIPKKSFFETLGSISCDDMEKERLLELGSPQGLDDLLDYCVRCRRTVAETLQDFPKTAKNISPDRLFDIFSYIRPRAFSIASNERCHPKRVELLVAKVEYKSRMSVPRRGLCSYYISTLEEGHKIFARIRSGTFNFPKEAETPVICIGPGTGVAPFRSFLSWRDNTPSDSVLFFGSRNSTKDYYFSDEWPNLLHTRVLTAFSRDQEEKIYVQNVIAKNPQIISELLREKKGMVFVAGSAGAMPEAVVDILNRIGAKYDATEPLVDYLEKRGRIQYETWS
ncbi:unnamed protein product [Auanema sp. JU1783]|nr:unnamed protein product [Auanema sp. JU1783]